MFEFEGLKRYAVFLRLKSRSQGHPFLLQISPSYIGLIILGMLRKENLAPVDTIYIEKMNQLSNTKVNVLRWISGEKSEFSF